VASLIFLMARSSGVGPTPEDPAEVAALNHQDGGVDQEQMPVFHGADIK
jgi:hypothetical protein